MYDDEYEDAHLDEAQQDQSGYHPDDYDNYGQKVRDFDFDVEDYLGKD
jgi:hypothetical protein